MRKRRVLSVVTPVLLVWSGVADVRHVPAQSSAPVVYAIPIEGMIDLGLAPFLARTIREAEEAGAAAVLLDINTFGGRVDAAVTMRDALLNSPVRTIAFVDQRAISAGALIALACDTLIMTTGGTIGAATPVVGGGTGETQPADEKSVSYVRSEFRATAEARNRPAAIAEAMVDADVEIAGVIKGQAAHAHDVSGTRAQGGRSERGYAGRRARGRRRAGRGGADRPPDLG